MKTGVVLGGGVLLAFAASVQGATRWADAVNGNDRLDVAANESPKFSFVYEPGENDVGGAAVDSLVRNCGVLLLVR